jgi:hypothetical protein
LRVWWETSDENLADDLPIVTAADAGAKIPSGAVKVVPQGTGKKKAK